MLLKKIFWFWWRKKKYDSEFLSYNLMLNPGKKFRALHDKKNKYPNSHVLSEKTFLNETKNHNPPPPFQVKWSVPKQRLKTDNESVQGFLYRLFIYIVVCDPDIKKGIGIPLTRLTPQHCCACPKPGHGFPMPYVVIFFVFGEFS